MPDNIIHLFLGLSVIALWANIYNLRKTTSRQRGNHYTMIKDIAEQIADYDESSTPIIVSTKLENESIVIQIVRSQDGIATEYKIFSTDNERGR